jgi:hypothetical protein
MAKSKKVSSSSSSSSSSCHSGNQHTPVQFLVRICDSHHLILQLSPSKLRGENEHDYGKASQKNNVTLMKEEKKYKNGGRVG